MKIGLVFCFVIGLVCCFVVGLVCCFVISKQFFYILVLITLKTATWLVETCRWSICNNITLINPSVFVDYTHSIHLINANGSSSSIGTTAPYWVLACSTIVEPSQQEGFYRVLLPAARQTPNLEDQWLERSNSRHKKPPASETTQANPSSGRWKYGREMAEKCAESGDFHVTFGYFYMP